MVSINSLIVILAYTIAVCGMIPLFPWLERAPQIFFAAGLIAGIWQERRSAWPIKNWMSNVAIVPLFLFYAFQFSTSNPVQPVVSVLTVMLAVRLAGIKNSRHYLQISAISLFCLASSSLFDLSLTFLIYLGLMLFLVALQLVLLTFYNQEQNMRLTRPELRKIMAAGLLMPLASLPLLAFFFPVLPRTQIPLWHFLPATTARTSGFSDAVEPGASSSLGSSRQLVLRAEMPRLPQQQLYWRGTVFNLIDGRRWVRTAPAVERSSTIGTRIRQTIYPEPGSSRFLIALDAPAVLDLQRSRRLTDCLYEFTGAPGKRFTYTADSVPSGRLVSNGSINRSFYLTLPLQLPQRIRQLADSIRTAGDSDLGRVERLENYFRNGSFRYSRSGLSTGEDAIEKFLFENRQGHCEFFASSFAMVLRAAGVPTRLVGGFLGGEYNQLGGYYLVTDDMAHVWVEVFIDGQGWLRIDPSRFASNADTVWSPSKKSMLLQIRMAMDSLDHAWNRTVITYDFERQLTVARSVGTRLQGFESGKIAKTVIPYLAGMAVLAVIIAVLMYRKTLFPLRETRLLHAFYRTVERDCAVQVDRGREGVFEVAARTGNSRVREFADIYAGVVYRDRRLNEQEYLRLKTILKEGFRHVA